MEGDAVTIYVETYRITHEIPIPDPKLTSMSSPTSPLLPYAG